jgi:hypothetical protein
MEHTLAELLDVDDPAWPGIEAAIARRKLDGARTRGAIALAAGFSLRCIDEDTPDDPARLAQLQAAAATVLGERV